MRKLVATLVFFHTKIIIIKKLRKLRRKQNIENWHNVADYAKQKGIKNIMWEPMSISREQGETQMSVENYKKTLINIPHCHLSFVLMLTMVN